MLMTSAEVCLSSCSFSLHWFHGISLLPASHIARRNEEVFAVSESRNVNLKIGCLFPFRCPLVLFLHHVEGALIALLHNDNDVCVPHLEVFWLSAVGSWYRFYSNPWFRKTRQVRSMRMYSYFYCWGGSAVPVSSIYGIWWFVFYHCLVDYFGLELHS